MVCYGTIGRHHGPPSGLTWFFGIAFEFLLFVGPCSIGKLEHCYTKITLNFKAALKSLIIPSKLYEYDSHHHLCLKYNFRLKACQLEQLKNESYNADYSTNVPRIFARTFSDFERKLSVFGIAPKPIFVDSWQKYCGRSRSGAPRTFQISLTCSLISSIPTH